MAEVIKVRWDKFFYCPVFNQRLTLQMCCHRATIFNLGYVTLDGDKHPELAPQFEHCASCSIRLAASKRYLRPNMPIRHPRLAEGDEKKLRKMINKRHIRLFGE